MPHSLRYWRSVLCFSVAFCSLLNAKVLSQEVRGRAVIDLTMDASPDDPSLLTDSAQVGETSDRATIQGDARRIPSILGAAGSGQSLMLDAGKSQYLSIASSADVSRADAITVSGVFASLHAESEKGFRGLFAKRQPDGKRITNYGINFDHSSDVFQLYVNDGDGFRIARYSTKQVLGSRRRVHLTVSLQTADAPNEGQNANDQDTDADDLELRVFVNGVAIAPASASHGFVHGTAAWLTDITLASCISDTPVTVGASFTEGELTSLIADDFLIFPEAISAQDAATLFREVCGAAADNLTNEQKGATPAAQEPVITRLSTRGLQIGTTGPLIVQGRMLEDVSLHFSLPGITAVRREGATAQRAVFDVTVDEETVPARCLVYAVTESGLSAGEVICTDRLRQVSEGELTESTPLSSGSVAVSGILAGTEQEQIWFQGRKGDVIVAEVEARRLGSRLDPVVEIKNSLGAPLAVQWQQAELAGDARVRVVLPEDGLYFAEIHDLRFRAPGNSHWRLLLGPLHAAALAFPTGSPETENAVALLGAAGAAESVTSANDAVLPVPPLADSAATDVVEPIDGTFPETPFDAKFTAAPFSPMSVWGRISEDEQTDKFRLTVTPGQNLYFSVFARRLSSPLRPQIALRVGENVVMRSNGENGASDPSLTWTVPEKVESVQVEISDFTGRGSSSAMYRVDVSRNDRPGFRLEVATDRTRLPRNGAIPLRIQVVRKSESFQYFGPIHLSVQDAPGVQVVPSVLKAGKSNSEEFVMLVRNQDRSPSTLTSLTIEATTFGLDADITETVHVSVDADRLNTVSGIGSRMLTVASPAVPALVTLSGPPPVLFRGTTTAVPLQITPHREPDYQFIVFALETNQAARREKPNDPQSPLKPAVAATDLQFIDATAESFPLQVSTPLDTPEEELTAVVSAGFVDQPLANGSDERSWTAPIRLPIRDAVTLKVPEQAVTLVAGGQAVVMPQIEMHPLFHEPVRIRVSGLPEGLQISPVEIPADHYGVARLEITAATTVAQGPVSDVTLTIVTEQGNPLTAAVPVSLNITAPAK